MSDSAENIFNIVARGLVAGALLVALTCAAGIARGAPTAHDVRILVDISGSMKHTDPGNLRIPALRMLTGILPAGTRAGVWTFGRDVNMLVPYDSVDDGWRERAMQATGRIGSVALHTNIEAVLETATWNWQRPDDSVQRSLLLFTDGMVDIPGGKAPNAQSRSRILDEVLPRLQRAGVRIHTVALSEEADATLLRGLAAGSGGRFEQTDNAAELDRIFLRLFDRAVEPDNLPVDGGLFLVDDTVEELTILAFRDDAAQTTRLTAPDGTMLEAGTVPAQVRWHNAAGFDLVTISEPAAGNWRIDASSDPDNRVMVVSKLRLQASRPEAPLAAGDRYRLTVSLTENGEIIEKRDFLHFVRVEAGLRTLDGAIGATRKWMLLDNGRGGDTAAGDGVHTLVLDDGLRAGRHELVIDVDGTTFRRSERQLLEVAPGAAGVTPAAASEESLPATMAKPAETAATPMSTGGHDWTVIGLSVLLANLLLLAATGYAWRRWVNPVTTAGAGRDSSAAIEAGALSAAAADNEPMVPDAIAIETNRPPPVAGEAGETGETGETPDSAPEPAGEAQPDGPEPDPQSGTEPAPDPEAAGAPADEPVEAAPAPCTGEDASSDGQDEKSAPSKPPEPEPARMVFDEEIVLQGINVDEIDLDFEEDTRRTG